MKVRILPGAGQTHGILVEPANPGDPDIDGVKIKGFTVEGFPNNGIWLRHVNNFKIEGNESINNLENGIWPTLSANGHGEEERLLRLAGQRAVGRGVRERPRHQERAPPQPDGPRDHGLQEHPGSKKNNIHDNTVGIGLYHPDGGGAAAARPVELGNWDIVDNHVHDNNEPNTAPPGSMSAALPPGGGILVLGVDDVDRAEEPDREQRVLRHRRDRLLRRGGRTAFDCAPNPPDRRDRRRTTT